MAKVEIEDRAFQDPALVAASSKHRIAKAIILGYAAVLWRMSQQARVISADRQTILGWLDTDRFAKPKKAFDWLVASRHLIPNADQTLFEIHGNSFRVPRISKRIENAKAAVTIREQKKSSIDSISNRSSKRYPDRETGRQGDRKTVSNSYPVSPDQESPKVKKYTFAEGDMKAAVWFQRQVMNLNPLARKAKKANLEAWAQEFRLLRESDDLTQQQIAAVALFALSDLFWRDVIQSPAKLRKQWDTLSARMQTEESKPRGFRGTF